MDKESVILDNFDFIQNEDELEFAIFCIENTAVRMHTSADKVFDILTRQSNILQKYVVPNYETLHTQGKDYIVEDILSVMKEQGVY